MIKNVLESTLITIPNSVIMFQNCKKGDKKLSAIIRICKFMSLKRRRGLMESSVESLGIDVL